MIRVAANLRRKIAIKLETENPGTATEPVLLHDTRNSPCQNKSPSFSGKDV